MSTKITNNRPEDISCNIMGTDWTITWRTKEEDPHLVECDGYCDSSIRTIIVAWFEWDGMNHNDMAAYTAKVIRHEMIHAMLYESGLDVNTARQWARNEEMVDWIAIQLPKMCNTILPVADKVNKKMLKDLTIVE
jgi:hypothetical protein